MRRYIKELKPTNIFDVMAMVALYRPGPMQNIPDFIARKHDPSKITFPDPRLEEILANSYGILTYQDDVLLTTIALAGYTWLDADKFRKAMGKKIPAEMKKQKEIFIQGAIKNGLTLKKAEDIFELIAPFAGYGFNKAHASCYATIAFRTAYLKAHFPVEFMTALLTAESRGSTGPQKNEKISVAVAECKRLKIDVLGPNVNRSEQDFSIEDNKVRFGLSAVKNVGSAAISTILEAREKGEFTGMSDFCSRVDLSKVNKKTLESLIKAGAFDDFGKRASLLSSITDIVSSINKKVVKKPVAQVGLFGDLLTQPVMSEVKTYDEIEDFTESEKLMFERELLGFFLSDHPLNQKLNTLFTFATHKISDLPEVRNGSKVKIGGLVATVKKIFTKRSNEEMAFVSIEDHLGVSIECVVFPKIFERTKGYLVKDAIVIIEGKLDFKEELPVIIVDGVRILN
jgi:DNA polymerase-3 subunit alpha